MPEVMLKTAMMAAYGNEELPENLRKVISGNRLEKEKLSGIQKKKAKKAAVRKDREFQLGDSVMVYPDKKIGIVCGKANEKGVLRGQMADKKIWINHKRIKLHVAAEEPISLCWIFMRGIGETVSRLHFLNMHSHHLHIGWISHILIKIVFGRIMVR